MVVVVMMAVAGDGLDRRGRGAAVGGLAAGDLELQRGVVDVEAVAQGLVEALEDGAAVRHRHLGDGDVAGERVRARAERPDVQVVNVEHALDAFHGGAHVLEL